MTTQRRDGDVTTIARIGHSEAMELAAEENRRFLLLLEQLGPEHWGMPTDCTRWSVRDVTVHVIASAEAQASPREFLRQAWQGRKLLSQNSSQHWATRHHDPFSLILTGPAGGRFRRRADNSDDLEIDAIECCRILSGRGRPQGVLRHPLPL
ncbi:hypothetical protein QF031_001646 [Pseudarthrobacter defluvii]|uniref:maleylpyruvate isomerase N-terminal domain-containing protein n=1 Tax=Pseudarthrobacter defluvii TaxID=410837 RepID=UPI002780111D|nr:maleylpyruvate isomerase N-terminal domain-containing protein [Pseudarthrobacter defluvii]MDQ0768897.1 hypothetical protein [Pseudarthrobacter defluvii]